MEVFVVYKQYSNWEDNNGTDILGVFSKFENAEKKMQKEYEREMDFIKCEEIKIKNMSLCKNFVSIKTEYGDVDIFVKSKEVE